MKLSPGLIVLLYRRRWDLEKVYDQFKNKFHEKKSWASSVTAKSAQAVFLCLVHNLMVCYEATLAKAGLRNTAEEKRRKKVLTDRTAKVKKPGVKCPSSFPASSGYAGTQAKTTVQLSPLRFDSQRTVKFIRWLRCFLWQTHPLDVLLLFLKKRYATL